MTQPSFSARVSAAINEFGNVTSPVSSQPAKHKALNDNSILLQINKVNAPNIKLSIEVAAYHHFQSLRVPYHNSMFSKMEELQLEPGQTLIVKKEENDSISLSFAKERKIRIGKALGKAVNCLRGTPLPRSDRTSFGGLFGNRFIVEKPALIITAPTEDLETHPSEHSFIENNAPHDDSDDAFSMIDSSDAHGPMDPPGETMQNDNSDDAPSMIHPDNTHGPMDPPGKTIQSHYSIYPSQPDAPHYFSPHASLPIIDEGSGSSSDDELSTAALSGHNQHGLGSDLDAAQASSLKPPKLGGAKTNSEEQELSSFIELAYQQSKPQDRLQVAIAGHGSLDINYESFEIPPNVTVRTWRIPGQVLSDPIGKQIEELRPGESIIIKQKHSDYLYETIFKPGDRIPNYSVYPPTGLNISHESITVREETSLSKIIKQQVENYDGAPIQIEFSACQSYHIPKFGVSESQNIENLRTRLGIIQRDVAELVNQPREKHNQKILTYHREALDDLRKNFTEHKTQYPFELSDSTGGIISDKGYVDFILSEISTELDRLIFARIEV